MSAKLCLQLVEVAIWPAEIYKLCKMRKKRQKLSIFCILSASEYWSIWSSLTASPSRPFVDSPDANGHSRLNYLMTGWLHIRKHLITAWYSKQAKQCCEDSVCLAHMDSQDLIKLKSKWPVPCVPARFECMLSSVCVSILSTVHAQTHDWVQPISMCFVHDAHVQHLPQYLNVSWSLYNEFVFCFEDGILCSLI